MSFKRLLTINWFGYKIYQRIINSCNLCHFTEFITLLVIKRIYHLSGQDAGRQLFFIDIKSPDSLNSKKEEVLFRANTIIDGLQDVQSMPQVCNKLGILPRGDFQSFMGRLEPQISRLKILVFELPKATQLAICICVRN